MPNDAPTSSLTVAPFAQFLDELSAKTPAPGGGAAAGAAGALAGALGRMVVSYSLGRNSLAEHEGMLGSAAARLDRARAVFVELANEDAAAYRELNALMKKPEDDPDRLAREPGAIDACVGAPGAMLAAANDLLRLLDELCGASNEHLRSDLAIAAVLAEAAAASAAWNVRVNLALIKDDARRAQLSAETDRGVDEAARRRVAIERACARAPA